MNDGCLKYILFSELCQEELQTIIATPTYEELLRENRWLRERLAALERELAQLRAENAQLRRELEALRQELAHLQDQEEKGNPPPFVKPRRQTEEPQPPGRKAGHQGRTRPKLERVDEERELSQRLPRLPDQAGSPCGGAGALRLGLAPTPSAGDPLPDRPLPPNRVQQFLADVGLELSEGTIEQVCTEVAYHPDARRSHEVAEELVGPDFPGVVTCDFYSAYNPVEVSKQRCWAHLLRETRELESEEGEQLHRELKELRAWIEGQLARFGEWAVEQLAQREWSDPQYQRIAARLRRHLGELFTFAWSGGHQQRGRAGVTAVLLW